ncbi:ABC transporter ATP-binding protein [Nocardioides sp. Soil796]|uniref:ABC transporter ATP-binding protein n=1 Tax=Nocardioides sp. Soil796 TaxID=1736412 RepID=UPI0007110D1B|nr:ABC transporter ATP-binding protein [Nocardioides sp. Soil796]KRF12843.1 multidrug ABC transporter permease [Nocardioides sp. Soil796]
MSRDILPIADRRETSRLAWQLMRRHPVALALATASFAIAGLAALVAPWMLGQIVDAVREGAPGSDINRYAVIIATAAVLGAVATWASVSFLARAGEPALAELREEVLDKALGLDSARVEAAGTGDLLSRVGDDARAVANSLTDIIPTLVNSLVLVGFTAVGLFALDWRLGLAGLATIPFYVMGLRWYLPRSGPFYARERVAQGERAQALVSGLQGAPTLRAYALEDAHVDEITKRSDDAREITVTVFALLTRFFARSNRAELIGLCLVLGTGFWLVRADEVTVGAVTAAALYFHRLFNPIGALLFIFDEVQSTGASLARLAGVSLMQPPPTGSAVPPASPGPLELLAVCHEYVEGRPVLSEVTLTIAPGERVALVGATGAGKTTLGAIAAGVLPAGAGAVSLAGVPYDDLAPDALRSKVSLISQDVHVFSGTVREAVTLVDASAGDEAVRSALAAVSALGWVDAMPDGLETVVGDGGHPLTPAQAQQLALARIVLADPWFVVLDEATAEAGSAGARDLERAALAVTEGRGALVVAHRLTQSESADRVLVLHEGRVVESGSHPELLAAGGRYAELWAAWSGD